MGVSLRGQPYQSHQRSSFWEDDTLPIFKRWEGSVHWLGKLLQVEVTTRTVALKQGRAWHIPESIRRLPGWQQRKQGWKWHKIRLVPQGAWDGFFFSFPICCEIFIRFHCSPPFEKQNTVAIRKLNSEPRWLSLKSRSALCHVCSLGASFLIYKWGKWYLF